MGITYLTIIFAMAIAITAVGIVAVYWSTRHPEEKDSHSLAKFEKHWTAIILIVFIAFSASTLAYLPYPYAHSNANPNMIVHVQARQFSWCLTNQSYWGRNCSTEYQIPLDSTVQFEVNSSDTTHGFGVYDSGGTLLFQVQVMPGFINNITYTFSNSGIYYIRCLEFCGYGHYAMYSQFNVTTTPV